MEGILIILVVGLIVAGMVFVHRQARKRREALRAFAADRSLTFVEGHDSDHDDRFARFAMFRKGHSRAAFNTMEGTILISDRSVRVRTGDFRFREERGSGKNRRTVTINLSYLVVWNPFGVGPETIVRREGLFDRLKGVLGFDDIDFESVEFSKAYHVSSEDKRFAYDLIDPRMMEFIMSTSPPAFEIDGEYICISDGKSLWDTEAFGRQLDWAGEFLNHWPRHLVKSMADQSASMRDHP
jgi:hypothetical protein